MATATGHISVGSVTWHFTRAFTTTSFVKTKIQFIVSMNYDRNSSTILRVVAVFQPQRTGLRRIRSRKMMNMRRVRQAKMTTSSDMLLTGGDCR